jgi:hypothetical protein
VHNPCYAGAYAFGRTRTFKTADGRVHIEQLPRDDHVGYISWEEHEEHLRRLRAHRLAFGSAQRLSPPREGPALLQGLVLCGWCGARMSVRYHNRNGRPAPDYVCQDAHVHPGGVFRQRVPGKDLTDPIWRRCGGAAPAHERAIPRLHSQGMGSLRYEPGAA